MTTAAAPRLTGEQARTKLLEMEKGWPGYLPVIDSLFPLEQCEEWVHFTENPTDHADNGYYRRSLKEDVVIQLFCEQADFQGLDSFEWIWPMGEKHATIVDAFHASPTVAPLRVSLATVLESIPIQRMCYPANRIGDCDFHAYNRASFMRLLANTDRLLRSRRHCIIKKGRISLSLPNEEHLAQLGVTSVHDLHRMTPKEAQTHLTDLNQLVHLSINNRVQALNRFSNTAELRRIALNE